MRSYLKCGHQGLCPFVVRVDEQVVGVGDDEAFDPESLELDVELDVGFLAERVLGAGGEEVAHDELEPSGGGEGSGPYTRKSRSFSLVGSINLTGWMGGWALSSLVPARGCSKL